MSKTDVKVSIIVPIYNVEKYLERCVESLINQTMKEIEIILVNDGSTDGSGIICDNYKKIYNNIKVIHKKNGGLSETRNFGIKIASGDFLLFVDSDDWCCRNMVEKLYNTIKEDNSDIAICGYNINYTNNNYIVKKSLINEKIFYNKDEIHEAIYNLDKHGMFNIVWNKMYKNELIQNENIRFEKDAMPGEDLIFNCDYLKKIDSISFVNLELYNYMRQDEDTLVTKYRNNLYEKCKKFNSIKKDLYDYYNMFNDKYMQCYSMIYIEYMYCSLLNIYKKECDLSKKNKREFINALIKDSELIKYMKIYVPTDFHGRLFRILYKTKSSVLIYYIYSILFFLRYELKGIYMIFRKKIIN